VETDLLGPPTSLNAENFKSSDRNLTSDSIPGRCASSHQVTINFTLLPEVASSVSFFFAGTRSILEGFLDSRTCTVRPINPSTGPRD
jgi:hypothetical protein